MGYNSKYLTHSTSSIYQIYFELQFKALIEGAQTPIVFTKELYIGTVPMSRKEMKSCMAGMFNQPYAESVEALDVRSSTSQASLTQIIAAASAESPKAQPTAPSLDTMERVDMRQDPSVSLICGEPVKDKVTYFKGTNK